MSTPSWNERVYRFFLRAYPRSFRRQFESDLVTFFRRDRHHPRYSGPMGWLRFWKHTTADLARTAWEQRRHNEPSPPSPDRPKTHVLRTLFAEVRAALKRLTREPKFAAVSILTLGLGIGAATAVFTVVHSMFLTPLPFPDHERLVRVYERERENPNARMVAYGNYADLQRDADTFEELAIWAFSSHTLTDVNQALRLNSREVSSNFARTLGVGLELGRWISEVEASEDRAVVVLSHAIWQNAFNRDPDLIGQTITLDEEPYIVVGVAPPGFNYPNPADAWVPLRPVIDPSGSRQRHRHNMIGRLRDGVSVETATSQLNAISQRLETQYPIFNRGNFFQIQRLLDTYVANARASMMVLGGAVIALLLIACTNIASLFLARSTSRKHELALRTALGASRGRLVALMLCEALILGIGGGILGILVAQLGINWVASVGAGIIPRVADIAMRGPVFAFVALISIATAAAVSLVPVWSTTRTSHAQLLREARASGNRRTVRSRRILVCGELALAFVLAVGASTLLQSFARLNQVDSGVQTENVLSLNVRLARGTYPDETSTANAMDNMLRTVETLPEVQSAAAVLTPPVTNTGWFNTLTIRDRPVPEGERPPIGYNVITSRYFATLGVPIIQGRAFDDRDRNRPVVLINRAAADQHWPGEDPIGKFILGQEPPGREYAEVIGVVENIRQSLTEPTVPEAYVPLRQDRVLSLVIVVRTTTPPYAAAEAVQAAIRATDPNIPINGVQTLSERLDINTARPAFTATLMSSFAGVALFLAGVGVYGVIAYSVAERRREFGIRIAVGAKRERVLGQVIREASLLGAVAISLGLVTTLVFGRALNALLFEVAVYDPLVLLTVTGVIGLLTLLSAIYPAQAATAVDPLIVLREE